MRIAVDAMGGDYAPERVVDGAVAAARVDGSDVLLVGRSAEIERELGRLGVSADAPIGGGGRVEIVHAESVVDMDESPIAPLRKKRDSSIRICAELVKEGRAAAFVTAGNTGAAMIAAKVVIGTIPGVDRPALAAVFPNVKGRTVVLDVGANVDSKASHLREFAVMGHFFAQEVIGTPAPSIGLLSIGTEAGKGTDFTREVFKVLEKTGLNFLGNVEGRDLFNGAVDVVVCDGFAGNVALKSAESLAGLFATLLKQELTRSWRTKLGYLLAKPAFDALRERTDYTAYGAAPLLGVEGGCFIGHGSSNGRAIHSAIRRATEFAHHEVHKKIRAKVAELHTEEELLFAAKSESEAAEIPGRPADEPADAALESQTAAARDAAGSDA